MKNLVKLNLGCGKDIKPKSQGWINVDIKAYPGVDKVVDLNKKLPFKDNSVDELYCHRVLEFIDDLYGLMQEIHRICKSGAVIRLTVPHFSSTTAIHPYHYHLFPYNGVNLMSPKKFKLTKAKITFKKKGFLIFNRIIEPIMNLIPHFYDQTFLHNLFPAWEIEFEIKIVK